MFISKECLIAILENLRILNGEVDELKKRIADLDGQVQGNQEARSDVDVILRKLKLDANRRGERYV